MKILWLCPIMLPDFAEHFGEKRNPKGGWITGLLNGLKNRVQIDLICPSKTCSTWDMKQINGTTVYTLKRTEDLKEILKEIIISSNPDIIHIWGTEKKMSYDMVCATEELGLLEKTVVFIQGLLYYEGLYHFYCHLPIDIVQLESPVEYKYQTSLQNQRKWMIHEGEYEIEVFKKAKYFVGRTDYDEACVKQINPTIQYFKCYETLRNEFYKNKWEYDKCEKYSIFVSQSHYPVKGFHLMLDAMRLILQRYPSAKLYTTGKAPKIPETFVEKCTEKTYPSYIARLIKDNHLENNVEFLGILGEKKMCDAYLKANVSVCCSSIENESNSVAEAMLLGMPVVASNVGGISTFIEHNINGFLYQSDAPYMLAHYICKIFDDSEKAIAMGNCARKQAQVFFDANNNANETLQIYSNIIKH